MQNHNYILQNHPYCPQAASSRPEDIVKTDDLAPAEQSIENKTRQQSEIEAAAVNETIAQANGETAHGSGHKPAAVQRKHSSPIHRRSSDTKHPSPTSGECATDVKLQGSLSIAAIKSAVASDALGFAQWLFPQGKKRGHHWHIGNVWGEPGESLSVNISGQYAGYFRDWATGLRGDCIQLAMTVRDVDFGGALQLLAVRYSSAQPAIISGKPRLGRNRQQRKKEASQRTFESLELRPGNDTDLTCLSRLRNVTIEALEIATDRGLLWFYNSREGRAFVITDRTRKNVQARRLDGRPWRWNKKKAWTLKGSAASWPIGLQESAEFPCIAICEGGPDFLAAFHHALIAGVETEVAPICMTGASLAIPDECVGGFVEKHIRIFVHDDEEGRLAGNRWAQQLRTADACIDGFTFDGLIRTDGLPVKDLCDMASIHVDSWELHQHTVENCMTFHRKGGDKCQG